LFSLFFHESHQSTFIYRLEDVLRNMNHQLTIRFGRNGKVGSCRKKRLLAERAKFVPHMQHGVFHAEPHHISVNENRHDLQQRACGPLTPAFYVGLPPINKFDP